MSHTKGPWAIDPERPTMANGVVLGYYIRYPKSGGRIGQVFENCLVKTPGEALANARLFAAGPDLGRVLQLIVAHEHDARLDIFIREGRELLASLAQPLLSTGHAPK